LGFAGRARIAAAALRLPALGFALVIAAAAHGQCPADPQQTARIHQSFEQRNWAETVRMAAGLRCRPAATNFELGLALGHLQRWAEARAALLAGRPQSRGHAQERFDVELAGIAFEQKHYPEAAAWIRHALKLDPKDDYAESFAGTVYFLMGNTEAALKYWNGIQKPHIAGLHFDPRLRVQRLLLDRAFAFSPAALLRERDWLSTEARLDKLGIFSTYNITLAARGDGNFDADFHAIERDGFGISRLQALVSTFGGAAYETVYPDYFNIRRSGINFESLLRWDSQKYRAWLSLSGPVRDLPQFRWAFSTDDRDENWTIRRSFAGVAPPLGALNLQRETAAASFTAIHGGRLEWSIGGELSHRAFHHVVLGSALTPSLVSSGFELKQIASVSGTLVAIPERRVSLTAGASSQAARLWSNPSRLFEKLQASALAHWFPQAVGDRYEAQQQLRAGRTFGTAPFDEIFMLGVERDNDLWLRGHTGTRDRQKGSAPLGYSYLLSNSDFDRRVYTNGLFAIKAGPFLDIGRMGAPTSGLATRQWLFDGGIEAKLSVLRTTIVLTYGRDLRAGTNAFYGTLAR
jgi:tetratricopeptide (TPR) repeat protein